MEFCRLRRPISFPPSRSRGVERRAGDWQFSGARGVSCCSPTSFSSAQVRASFTPHTSTPVPLPCAHQRAEIRSRLTFCHKRSVRALVSLPQEQIDARGDREVKMQTAWRQRIEYHYDLFREWRGSRGRHGAGDASADASLACARLWACLGSACSRLGQWLGCRLRRRLCGPELSGRCQSGSARARARRVASARAYAIALDRPGHPGCSACPGQAREHKICNVVARWDRPSVGALGGGHEGSVWPSGGGLRACMSSRDRSGALEPSA